MADITAIEQTKIQAAVLIPVLKAFQKEFGEERANVIAKAALADWAYKLGQNIGAQGEGTAAEKVVGFMTDLAGAGGALDLEVLEQTPDRFDVNVTE